jgi:hypothetical protein
MRRQPQKRSVPTRRAVLALTASLSVVPDVDGGHQQRNGAAATIDPEVFLDEATSTQEQLGLRSKRELNHRRNRNRNRNRNQNRNNDAEVQTTTGGGVGGGSIRLRLYWEQGYFWQEDKDEMWWCMGESFSVDFLISEAAIIL